MSGKDLAELLGPETTLSREEPEIATNIGIQLEHMGLTPRSISVLRRIRDIVARIRPRVILEVGGGIGHLSAWLFDLFEDEGTRPDRYAILEEGSRFAVIIKRLLDRYQADKYAEIIVGECVILTSEMAAWRMAGSDLGSAPLPPNTDLILVDAATPRLTEIIRSVLPLLSDGGLIITLEPNAPEGERDAEDPEVSGFNSWIELIKELDQSRDLAFLPLYGGTLVAIR